MIVNEDPASYGSKGEKWSLEFVKYMKSIVTHPVYANMPDAVDEDGKIQWEAPSNRSSGKFQHTHQKRRAWWQEKAKEIGIDPTSEKWISKTAKAIHPTGEKPCKRCGTILRIAYAYPNFRLILRMKRHFGADFDITPLESIHSVIQRVLDLFGSKALKNLQEILTTKEIIVPEFGEKVDLFLAWIEDVYIPSESTLLSPGAMSNAPDRFDGFHSFNKCCRGSADRGRISENLRSYITDRRVFEFWSEGDWIAADRLMGLVKTYFSKELNADGGLGLPTPDHIGPLSLGFCHRPHFRLLSKEANSAKNNRMTYKDVADLIADETHSQVISWHAKALWDLRKTSVDSDEKALRLSKMLRDNQRNAMTLLSYLFDHKMVVFLIYLLELDHADYAVEFKNLHVKNYLTVFDEIVKEKRDNKYAIEQKARRIRVGLEALRSYRERNNRHLFLIADESLKSTAAKVAAFLKSEAKEFSSLNDRIRDVLLPTTGAISEELLRELIKDIPTGTLSIFEEAKKILKAEMEGVAKSISQMWDDERYVRASFDLSA